MERYGVIQNPFTHPKKMVVWEFRDGYNERPTLAEIIEAAQKEFPGVPFDKLEVSEYGEDTALLEKR